MLNNFCRREHRLSLQTEHLIDDDDDDDNNNNSNNNYTYYY